MTAFKFGTRSKKNLESVHPDLQEVMDIAIANTPIDFMVICGWRSKDEQDKLFAQGLSKVRYPDSKHNHSYTDANTGNLRPQSLAIDFVPYRSGSPVDWSDTHAFAVIAGVMMAAAKSHGKTLRWGGDWDMDGSTKDQSFMDWGHVELVL